MSLVKLVNFGRKNEGGLFKSFSNDEPYKNVTGVFGIELDELCATQRQHVPKILVASVKFLEKKGIKNQFYYLLLTICSNYYLISDDKRCQSVRIPGK